MATIASVAYALETNNAAGLSTFVYLSPLFAFELITFLRNLIFVKSRYSKYPELYSNHRTKLGYLNGKLTTNFHLVGNEILTKHKLLEIKMFDHLPLA